jgi:antitoxin CcdA
MGKVELRIEVDAELLERAEASGVMLGPALEEGIRAALSRPEPARPVGMVALAEYLKAHPVDEEAAATAWAVENAEAIRDHERRIEEFGVFGEDLRTW